MSKTASTTILANNNIIFSPEKPLISQTNHFFDHHPDLLKKSKQDVATQGNITAEKVAILFPIKGTATKTFMKGTGREITKLPVKIGEYFRTELYLIDELQDLLELLCLLHDQDCFLIRGIPIEGINLDKLVRKKNGDDATFIDTPKHLIILDFDNVESPAHIDAILHPGDAVRWMIKEKLPSTFHDTDCVYQFSSSFGMEKEGRRGRYIKLHLFFWAKTPLTEAELRRWGVAYNLERGEEIIDCAVFGAVQPVFISPRKCLGFTDPARQPLGFMKGGQS